MYAATQGALLSGFWHIVLIFGSTTAICEMHALCDDYTALHHMYFNACISKGLFLLILIALKRCSFFVAGIERVESFTHLNDGVSDNLHGSSGIVKMRSLCTG